MKEYIIGVDPGTRCAGFGVIAINGEATEHVQHGVIRMKEGWSLPERLQYLQTELQTVFTRFPVTTAAVEKVFFGKNADSAFKLGHARGVCLLVAAQNGVAVEEYAARYVKKCMTGSGSASKDHVQMVIFNLLGIRPREIALDASDALSLALTHARMKDVRRRMKMALEGSL
ncbi:MAG: crossover junction endodeoxyribonuclease RuvC [Bdellovibrionales bacterium]